MEINKQRIFRLLDTGERKPVSPHFLDFHLMAPEMNYEYPEHRHEVYEVIVVRDGPYLCALNGVDITIHSGQQLVVQPGDRHQDHLRKGQEHYVLHFRLLDSGVAQFAPNALPCPGVRLFSSESPPSHRISMVRQEDAFSFFKWMESESTIKTESPELPFARQREQDARMEVLFWELIRALPVDGFSSEFRDETARQHFIGTISGVFSSRCHEDVSVDDLAIALNCSRRTLSDRCRRYLGISPAQAFLSYRIFESARFLLTGEYSVKETSDFFGFDNPFHFSRAFRRIMGVSPSEYR